MSWLQIRQPRRSSAPLSPEASRRSDGSERSCMTRRDLRTLTRCGKTGTSCMPSCSRRRTKPLTSRLSATTRTGGFVTRYPSFGSILNAVCQMETLMAFSGRAPGDPSNDDAKPGTAEIKQKLDDVIETGHEQLELTKEIRTQVAAIRRRLNADRPLILPRRTDELPSAPRRQGHS